MQSGFGKRRSANDNLVRLETCIREAFVQKPHTVAIFFDLEKAEATTQRGNTESLRIFLTLGFVDAYQCSFRASYRTDNSNLD